MTKEVDELQYINYVEEEPRFRVLCRDCEEYGSERKKLLTMKEGLNNITFRAVGLLGEIDETSVQFIVGSEIPDITKTLPNRIYDGFASGIFGAEFEEANPTELMLYIENTTITRSYPLNLNECIQTDDEKECSIGVELSEFEGGEINYWFKLTDLVGNFEESKKVELIVDTTPPVITSFGYSLDERRVLFVIGVNDANFDKIVYIDREETRPRERTLCTTIKNNLCQKTISFSSGLHNLDIFAFDEAGNGVTVTEEFEFFAG